MKVYKIAAMLESIVKFMEVRGYVRANTETKKFQFCEGSFKTIQTDQELGGFLWGIWNDDECPRDKRLVKLLLELYDVDYNVDAVYEEIRREDHEMDKILYAGGKPKPAHKVLSNMRDKIDSIVTSE